jgi:mRNA interferase MazF
MLKRLRLQNSRPIAGPMTWKPLMRRGDVFLLARPGGGDPGRERPFVVVSWQAAIDSNYNSVVCAPVYTQASGYSSQVIIGEECGLNHVSAIHCDGLTTVQKAYLTNYIGSLPHERLAALDQALGIAVGIDHLFDRP